MLERKTFKRIEKKIKSKSQVSDSLFVEDQGHQKRC